MSRFRGHLDLARLRSPQPTQIGANGGEMGEYQTPAQFYSDMREDSEERIERASGRRLGNQMVRMGARACGSDRLNQQRIPASRKGTALCECSIVYLPNAQPRPTFDSA